MKRASAVLIFYIALLGAALAQTFGPVPQVSITTNIPTYMVADVNIANTGAGDIFCLTGGASNLTKKVYINEIHVNATASAAIVVNISVIKRSSADTSGVSVAETIVPLVSNNLASIATAVSYTTSPTPGTAIGTVAAQKIAIGVQGNTSSMTDAQFFFGDHADQALRVTAPNNVCINVSAAGTGGSWSVYMRWTEQ